MIYILTETRVSPTLSLLHISDFSCSSLGRFSSLLESRSHALYNSSIQLCFLPSSWEEIFWYIWKIRRWERTWRV